MNDDRRDAIKKIEIQLLELVCEIELIQEDEQQAFENLPESLQYTEKGETMEEKAQLLEAVATEIETQASELIAIIE